LLHTINFLHMPQPLMFTRKTIRFVIFFYSLITKSCIKAVILPILNFINKLK
jgi:hypothetical protein